MLANDSRAMRSAGSTFGSLPLDPVALGEPVAVAIATWRATSHCNGPLPAIDLIISPKKGRPSKELSSGSLTIEMIWHLVKNFRVKNRDTLKPVNNSLKIAAGETFIQLTSEKLEVGATYDWAVSPRCGAVIVFSGTVRDHADGRDDVTALHYEAYETEVLAKLAAIAAEMRSKWPQLGRIALIHRIGTLGLGESSVLVVVSAPHRPEAFAAARFGIDALKATVPIWKREKWAGGDDWGTAAHDLIDIKDVGAPDHESSPA